MVSLDVTAMSPLDVYKLMIGCIVPRPIAFVSTMAEIDEAQDPSGKRAIGSKRTVHNLAPYSFFNGVCSSPPCLMFSVTRKPDGSKKDTLVNVEITKEFVVNTVAEWMIEAVNYCSGEFSYGVSEMQKAGLTPVPSLKVKPFRCKESPVQFECVLHDMLQVGEGFGSGTIIVGRIVQLHIHQQAYKDGKVLLEEIKPASRLAGIDYGKTTEYFGLKRPTPDEVSEKQ